MVARSITDIRADLISRRIAEGREAESLSRWLWEDVLQFNPHASQILSTRDEEKLESALQQLGQGYPVQYIAGHAWFYGLKLKVTPDVLIPRPETEELVDWIIQDLRQLPLRHFRILDIGTGSGCIPIVLKKKLGDQVDVSSMDVSEAALRIAKENAEAHDVTIHFIRDDFLQNGFPAGRKYDIIVSNPPYISQTNTDAEMVKGLRYEPAIALYPGGPDEDVFYRKIILDAAESLEEPGRVYIELNEFRAEQIQTLVLKHGWRNVDIREDLQGKKRMLGFSK